MTCSTNQDLAHQPFPNKGNIQLNQSLAALKSIQFKSHQNRIPIIYCYVVRTVDLDNETGLFTQTASAPNWQGDYITLCTCKHSMRTSWRFEDPKFDCWIAGFSGTTAHHTNSLLYLMKVGEAFDSYFDLYKAHPEFESTKGAHKNTLGDLYKPNLSNSIWKNHSNEYKENSPNFDITAYVPPKEGHIHRSGEDSTEWHTDIFYPKGRRSSKLLVGDPQHSYLWERNLINYWPKYKNLGRGHRIHTPETFLESLEVLSL